jgi:hypothetical protein
MLESWNSEALEVPESDVAGDRKLGGFGTQWLGRAAANVALRC